MYKNKKVTNTSISMYTHNIRIDAVSYARELYTQNRINCINQEQIRRTKNGG